MNKLLIMTVFAGSAVSALASSAVAFPINCNNNVVISESSTLQQVQSCVIVKQKLARDGMYEVEFSDNNKHKYTCSFASQEQATKINHCN